MAQGASMHLKSLCTIRGDFSVSRFTTPSRLPSVSFRSAISRPTPLAVASKGEGQNRKATRKRTTVRPGVQVPQRETSAPLATDSKSERVEIPSEKAEKSENNNGVSEQHQSSSKVEEKQPQQQQQQQQQKLPSMEVDAVTEAELKENGFRSTRRTKLICTIGPASCAPEQLEALAMGGMNVARINMCHGTREWHMHVIRNVRNLNSQKGYSVAIMMDTEGSEIHMGDLGGVASVKVEVCANMEFYVTSSSVQ